MLFLHRHDLPKLFNEIGLINRGVEVGVHRGEFTAILSKGWQGKELTVIDHWDIATHGPNYDDQREAYNRRLWETDPRIKPLITTPDRQVDSFENNSLDFVYLDWRRDYIGISRDLEIWWSKIRPGGILAGHDYLDGYFITGRNLEEGFSCQVRSAVDRFASSKLKIARRTIYDQIPSFYLIKSNSSVRRQEFRILSGTTDSCPEAKDSFINHRRYADFLNYSYSHRKIWENYLEGRSPHWFKIKWLIELLKDPGFKDEKISKTDWFFWVDGDCLFTGWGDMRFLCPVESPYHIVIPFNMITGITNGTMLVRNSPESLKILEKIWEGSEHYPNDYPYSAVGFNSILEHEPELAKGIEVVHHQLMESLPLNHLFEKGVDPIVHFPSINPEMKAQLIRDFSYQFARVINDL